MRSKGSKVCDGIDQNLISRMQSVSRCIRLCSAMRRGKAYIITGCAGRAGLVSLCFVRQNIPFAVIGTIAYCGRTYLDVRGR